MTKITQTNAVFQKIPIKKKFDDNSSEPKGTSKKKDNRKFRDQREKKYYEGGK
jgi:hypothetical protein